MEDDNREMWYVALIILVVGALVGAATCSIPRPDSIINEHKERSKTK